ncbi:MAG: hypothetical protein IM549_02370 [Pseudanabaena sp. M53BS1SP1A06MG]|nr:hypothetical protein [Pseudanabaena sp. M53BS1SP1A06MG]
MPSLESGRSQFFRQNINCDRPDDLLCLCHGAIWKNPTQSFKIFSNCTMTAHSKSTNGRQYSLWKRSQ